MKTRPIRLAWFIALVAFPVALGAATRAGWLDSLLLGGSRGRRHALLSIAAYATLAWLGTGAVFAWTKRRRQVLLAASSIALAILAFEIYARAVDLPAGIPAVGNMGMFSRAYHHRYPPDQTLRLGTVNGELLLLRTNEDGFRSSYARAEFLQRAPRIAILGDSFPFGLGVRQGAEFPVLLEHILRERTDNSELGVLNTGIVSFSPFLERWLFEDVVSAYQPDLVLVMVDVTDIGDDLRYENEASTGPDGRPSFELGLDEAESFSDYGPTWTLAKPLRQSLRLPFRIASRALGGEKAREYRYYRFDLEFGGERETNPYFIYRHPLEETRPYFERTLNNLREIASAVRSTGAEFAVVVIPRFQHWNAEECPENWEAGSYALDEPYQMEYFRFFREARGSVDFPILDLLPAFRATDEFPLVLRWDPHWNEAGHAFVARTLADELLAADLVRRD